MSFDVQIQGYKLCHIKYFLMIGKEYSALQSSLILLYAFWFELVWGMHNENKKDSLLLYP